HFSRHGKVSRDIWESDLFRRASLTWAVPVSNGFGRRLRHLVWDEHNDKLIGLIAIGDPVFNLSISRQLDQVGSLDARQASRQHDGRLCPGRRTSLQPAAGRKLLGCLVRSREIYNDLTRACGDTTGIISRRKKKARLLAITQLPPRPFGITRTTKRAGERQR